mmetsp:Transcript_13541/g.27817  ORF Transcript_13541/g.27817 Transcript_13541/m.27817 type:complete len:228 (-) Transcript_13541:502-1185(-)
MDERLLRLAQRANCSNERVQLPGLQVPNSPLLPGREEMRGRCGPAEIPPLLCCYGGLYQTSVLGAMGTAHQSGRVSDTKRDQLVRATLVAGKSQLFWKREKSKRKQQPRAGFHYGQYRKVTIQTQRHEEFSEMFDYGILCTGLLWWEQVLSQNRVPDGRHQNLQRDPTTRARRLFGMVGLRTHLPRSLLHHLPTVPTGSIARSKKNAVGKFDPQKICRRSLPGILRD